MNTLEIPSSVFLLVLTPRGYRQTFRQKLHTLCQACTHTHMHILYVDIWWKGYSFVYFFNIQWDALCECRAEGEKGGGDRWKTKYQPTCLGLTAVDLVGLKPMKCAGGIIGNNGITVLSHDKPVPSFLCFFLSSIKLPQGNVRFRRAHAHSCTHKL